MPMSLELQRTVQRELRQLSQSIELLSDVMRDRESDVEDLFDALQQALYGMKTRIVVSTWGTVDDVQPLPKV